MFDKKSFDGMHEVSIPDKTPKELTVGQAAEHPSGLLGADHPDPDPRTDESPIEASRK